MVLVTGKEDKSFFLSGKEQAIYWECTQTLDTG
jgi:hypothetical protein